MTVRRITLPFRAERAVLACGADLKGAFAFAKDEKAFLIYGFDDLSDPSNFARYEEAVKAYRKKLGIKPEIIVCDLHPNYFSTHFAENLHSFTPSRSRAHLSVPCHYQLCKVQHHEAHIASAIVDNDIKGTVIGIAFDGTGYGYDGNIWGGEFFTGDLKGFKRAAHLEYIPMPGGEKAIREPWRMAAGYLYRAFGKDFLKSGSRAYLNMPYRNMDSLKVLVKMIDGRINSPLTSSAGRLFDAVWSLVLSKGRVSKEA